MKNCTKCNVLKSDECFWKSKTLKSGLCDWCKSCFSEHHKKDKFDKKRWEKILFSQRRYRKLNAEKIKEKQKNKRKTEKFKVWEKNYLERVKPKKKIYMKKYSRSHLLKTKYGMTENDFNLILLKQGNVCAICGTNKNNVRKSGENISFYVDHNHETGFIRGLLCQKCNTGIGFFEVDIHGDEILRSAISYLSVEKTDKKEA
jgi:hypothetical protein